MAKKILGVSLDSVKAIQAYSKAKKLPTGEAVDALIAIGFGRWKALTKYSKTDAGKRAKVKATRKQTKSRSVARKSAKRDHKKIAKRAARQRKAQVAVAKLAVAKLAASPAVA